MNICQITKLKFTGDINCDLLKSLGIRKHKRDHKYVLASKWTREAFYTDEGEYPDKFIGYRMYPIFEIRTNGLIECYNQNSQEAVDKVVNIIHVLTNAGLIEQEVLMEVTHD